MERFFYEVHDVPLFTSRVHALRARQTFAAQARYLVIIPSHSKYSQADLRSTCTGGTCTAATLNLTLTLTRRHTRSSLTLTLTLALTLTLTRRHMRSSCSRP